MNNIKKERLKSGIIEMYQTKNSIGEVWYNVLFEPSDKSLSGISNIFDSEEEATEFFTELVAYKR